MALEKSELATFVQIPAGAIKMSNGDDTRQKQSLMPQWEKGQSGNPKGRPKGSRSKLSEAFLTNLFEDWEQHGVAAIKAVRSDKPDVYLRIVASILPKDLNVNVNKYEDLSDEELVERIEELDEAIRPFLESSSTEDTKH